MKPYLVVLGSVVTIVAVLNTAPCRGQATRQIQHVAANGSVAAGQPVASSTGEPVVLALTLEQAKEQALACNRQLLLGRLNLQEKQIAVTAAGKDYFPKLLGTAAYMHFNDDLGTIVATRDRQLGGAAIGPGGVIQVPSVTIPGRTVTANVLNQDTAVGAVMIAQPITKLIGVSALVDLARADAEIASAQLDKGTRELLSGVSQAYYGLLAARQIRAALALQAKALEPLLAMNPAPTLRLGALEVRKGLAETDKQVAELADLLNNLLGCPPCTVLELVEPTLPPVMVTCPEEAAEFALANNPQIREAQQNITKAQAGLKVAKMNFLPDVNVVGGYVAQSAADYIQDDFTAVGVTASYTFFEWGKRGDVRRQRETQITLAAQNVKAVAESVQLDARKTFLAFKQAEVEAQIAREVAQAREDAERDAKALPDMLTAKAATARAQLELMQAEVGHRVAHAKLLAVIGQP